MRGAGRARTATEALSGFKAFPQWLWRNADVLDFVGWLRLHNASLMDARADADSESRPGQARRPSVGFYGMDLYSLYPSISAVLSFLKRMGEHDLYERARTRYADFFRFSEGDPRLYGATATYLGSCERQALDELHDMIQLSTQLRRHSSDRESKAGGGKAEGEGKPGDGKAGEGKAEGEEVRGGVEGVREDRA